MKKNVLLFTVFMMIALFATAQDHHWPLKANLDDVVGGKNGTNFGVTFQNDDNKGAVAYFDGDSYAKLPSFINGLTEMTVSVWFRMDEKRVWSRIYSFGEGDQTAPKDVMMVIPTSGAVEPDTDPAHNMYRFTLSNPGEAWYDIDFFKDEVDIQIGEWYLSTVVLKPDSIILYHNDEQIYAESGHARAFGTLNDTENALGKSFWPDPNWKGALSDLRVYKTALQPSQVKALFDGITTNVKESTIELPKIYSANGKVYVKNAAQSSMITILNLAGQTISKTTLQQSQNIVLENGVYLVKVESPGKAAYTGKVLVK